MSHRSPRALLAALGLAACACSAESTAVDIPLVPDPNVNAPDDLTRMVGTVRVVLDAANGLYPGESERKLGALRIADVDGDGANELEAVFTAGQLDRLPLIRIERGGLPDVRVEVRVDGVDVTDPARTVAAGGVRGLEFVAGAVQRVEVPFNLKPRYRPPQVTQVIPPDGTRAQNEIASVFLVFPKRMSAQSLRAPNVFRLTRTDVAPPQVISPTEVVVQTFPGDDSPTTAEYRFDPPLAAGALLVELSEAATDIDGRALDQVPMEPGNQPFSSRFQFAAEMSSTTTPQTGPTPPPPCEQGGTVCARAMVCVERRCLPTACPTACAPGSVCDPAIRLCVSDCRPYGSYGGCPDERPSCGDDGLCVQ